MTNTLPAAINALIFIPSLTLFILDQFKLAFLLDTLVFDFAACQVLLKSRSRRGLRAPCPIKMPT